MYKPFDLMPGHARLWIYQANRTFSPTEKAQLNSGLQALCEQWSAHGAPLQTSFTIQFDLFVIMAVDEEQNGASGCSIDGSVRYLKSLQESLGLDFFDRTRVAFLQKGNVTIHPILELKHLFENQTLLADGIAFNNIVGTKADWEKGWQVPVNDSWLARYLPKIRVVN